MASSGTFASGDTRSTPFCVIRIQSAPFMSIPSLQSSLPQHPKPHLLNRHIGGRTWKPKTCSCKGGIHKPSKQAKKDPPCGSGRLPSMQQIPKETFGNWPWVLLFILPRAARGLHGFALRGFMHSPCDLRMSKAATQTWMMALESRNKKGENSWSSAPAFSELSPSLRCDSQK